MQPMKFHHKPFHKHENNHTSRDTSLLFILKGTCTQVDYNGHIRTLLFSLKISFENRLTLWTYITNGILGMYGLKVGVDTSNEFLNVQSEFPQPPAPEKTYIYSQNDFLLLNPISA